MPIKYVDPKQYQNNAALYTGARLEKGLNHSVRQIENEKNVLYKDIQIEKLNISL